MEEQRIEIAGVLQDREPGEAGGEIGDSERDSPNPQNGVAAAAELLHHRRHHHGHGDLDRHDDERQQKGVAQCDREIQIAGHATVVVERKAAATDSDSQMV